MKAVFDSSWSVLGAVARAALRFSLIVSASLLAPAAAAQQPTLSAELPTPQAPFSDAELDQMLAPIALYPDPLLALMFMAATYPAEIAQADSWAQAHPGWTEDQVQTALADEPWDPSVKSLAAVPQVLAWMAGNPQWTEALGEAFLAQGTELMDRVQALRQRAQQNGGLASRPQQIVSGDGAALSIEPANPQYVYVPQYQPDVVYGPWWWPEYPPYAFAEPDGAVFAAGYYFYPPIAVGPAFWCYPDWGGHRLVFDGPNYATFTGKHLPRGGPATWTFSPAHRRGTPFRSVFLRSQYGGIDPAHPEVRPLAPAPVVVPRAPAPSLQRVPTPVAPAPQLQPRVVPLPQPQYRPVPGAQPLRLVTPQRPLPPPGEFGRGMPMNGERFAPHGREEGRGERR